MFRFLSGMGLGAELPLIDIYLGELIPRYARGRYIAWAYMPGSLGVPLAGFVGKFVVNSTFLALPG